MGIEGREHHAKIPYKPRSIFNAFHDRHQRYAIGVAHRRAGKALDFSTLIPMADGAFWSIGTLREGDRVLDELGAPCTAWILGRSATRSTELLLVRDHGLCRGIALRHRLELHPTWLRWPGL
jgi:hypothetical protein